MVSVAVIGVCGHAAVIELLRHYESLVKAGLPTCAFLGGLLPVGAYCSRVAGRFGHVAVVVETRLSFVVAELASEVWVVTNDTTPDSDDTQRAIAWAKRAGKPLARIRVGEAANRAALRTDCDSAPGSSSRP